MIRDDWETFKYLATIGLIESVLAAASVKRSSLSGSLASQIILMSGKLCVKYLDVSIFLTVCLKNMRKLFNTGLGDEEVLVETLQVILSKEVIANIQLVYILCK